MPFDLGAIKEVDQMAYLMSGELVPQKARVITIDPSIEWDVSCMSAFVGVLRYAYYLTPVGNEIGSICGCRIVKSADTPNIKDIHDLKYLIWGRAA